jgi:dethiobiotin synthetase
MLVTGSHRDTISHTVTALGSLVRRDMKVLATIVNETPLSPIALDEVIASIARFTDPVIAYSARGTTEGNKKLVHLLSNAGAESIGPIALSSGAR